MTTGETLGTRALGVFAHLSQTHYRYNPGVGSRLGFKSGSRCCADTAVLLNLRAIRTEHLRTLHAFRIAPRIGNNQPSDILPTAVPCQQMFTVVVDTFWSRQICLCHKCMLRVGAQRRKQRERAWSVLFLGTRWYQENVHGCLGVSPCPSEFRNFEISKKIGRVAVVCVRTEVTSFIYLLKNIFLLI